MFKIDYMYTTIIKKQKEISDNDILYLANKYNEYCKEYNYDLYDYCEFYEFIIDYIDNYINEQNDVDIDNLSDLHNIILEKINTGDINKLS